MYQKKLTFTSFLVFILLERKKRTAERKREREMFQSIGSPSQKPATFRQGWVRPQPGTQNSISVSHLNNRDPSIEPSPAVPQDAHYRKVDWKWRGLGLKSGTLTWDMGVSSGNLIIAPNANP